MSYEKYEKLYKYLLENLDKKLIRKDQSLAISSILFIQKT